MRGREQEVGEETSPKLLEPTAGFGGKHGFVSRGMSGFLLVSLEIFQETLPAMGRGVRALGHGLWHADPAEGPRAEADGLGKAWEPPMPPEPSFASLATHFDFACGMDMSACLPALSCQA